MKNSFFLFLFLFFSLNMNASIIYVNKNATGLNNGTSWTNAYITIENAFNNSIVGDKIWISQGVYKPQGTYRSSHFTIPNGVEVYGSFIGNETLLSQRDLSNGAITTLNGDIGVVGTSNDNCYYVVGFLNASNLTILDGFKIVNGYNNSGSSYGGAIYNFGSQPTIRNCELIANWGSAGGGLGIDTNDSFVTTLINCKIKSNQSNYGGGIFIYSGTLKLIGCDVSNNSANYGGAVHVEFDYLIADRCYFSGNTASNYGGAIYLDNAASSATIYNSLIVGNLATEESFMGMNSVLSNEEISKVVNCTIANNRNSGTDPNTSFIISLPYNNGSIFHNNIIVNNISPREILNGDASNCIFDNTYNTNSSSNIINGTPTFINPNIPENAPFYHEGFNYRITSASIGINQGNNTLLNPIYNLDLDNNNRLLDSTVDIGSYEFNTTSNVEDYNSTVILFYPNPVNKTLFYNSEIGETKFTLFDSYGKIVRIGEFSSENQFSTNIENLSKGIYYIKTLNGYIEKIIFQ